MIRAIIADDHAFFRIEVRMILEKRGDIEVHEASDGAEAVAKALKLKPDVVILDLNMPVMSGYEALQYRSMFSRWQSRCGPKTSNK